MAYVGLISYGIYLWHFPVITAVRDRTDLRLYPEIVVGLAITLCARQLRPAGGSRLPFLRRKDRFRSFRWIATPSRGAEHGPDTG